MADVNTKKEIAKAILKDRVILIGHLKAMQISIKPPPIQVGGRSSMISKRPEDMEVDLTISVETLGDGDAFHSASLGSKKILIMEIE